MNYSTNEALIALGFTPLEAEVYVFLLTESPATGYRVAQSLERPVAGVYKTLESLSARGAVLVDEGANRHCRAVPFAELLSGMERTFQRRKAEAAEALSRFGMETADDRVYQLRTYDQVLERCRSMLSRSVSAALLDGHPGILTDLRSDIQAASARGVVVEVQTYGPIELPGATVNLFPQNEFVTTFPGTWLIAVIDGAELLLAFLDREAHEVRQAIYSGSPYLAFILQAFMISEFTFVAAMNDPDMPAEARDVVRRHGGRFSFRNRGYELLMIRFGLTANPRVIELTEAKVKQ